MAETKSMLMKLCAENVYNDNIFHLLGLRTTATPRQIRRKRDDFESAKALGEGAWHEAFKHLMGNRPVPTAEDVDEAFNHLEDPEYRIVSEFFWMWPTGEDDRALDELVEGRRNNALSTWEQEALGFGTKRIIAQHNLAVAYQFYALDAEFQALGNDGYMPQEFHTKMLSYWEKSFSYWEELVDNDEFWGIYESRMREFDDPRLTGDFSRRFRAEFPVAFDNINAQLAARYAKVSRFDDAKRHVEYMSRTMSGLDDVQENMNIIFTPMEQRVGLLIDGYDEKVTADPKRGLEYANKLLEETDEIRRVAEGLLKEDQRIRTGIFTKIVSACNRYQVQYGNKTDEWEGCLRLLMRLKEIACTAESLKVIEGNIATVKGNIKYDETESHCWFCKSEKATTRFDLKMYGDVVKIGNETHWRSLSIPIPACAGCCRRYKITRVLLNLLMPFTFIGAIMAGGATESWLVGIGVFVGMIIAYTCLSADNKCDEYPAVKAAKEKGFKTGERP